MSSWAASIERSTNLHELESIVERGLGSFIEVSLAVARIYNAKLYKTTHASWGAYCKQRWGWSRRHADRHRAAADVIAVIGPAGPLLPAAESHIRPLAGLPAEERRDAWREVVETAPDGVVTRDHAQAVVDRRVATVTPTPSGQLGLGIPGAPRRDLSQWDTRPETAQWLVEWAGVAPGARVLEPSAGKGNIIRALHAAGAEISAVELDEARADALEETGLADVVHCRDFLELAAEIGPGDRYDMAVMNPPYENGQDLAHILAALSVAPVVVVLARLVLLEGQARRQALWDAHTLARLTVLSERESFEGDVEGSPRSAFAAFQLIRGHVGKGVTVVEWR